MARLRKLLHPDSVPLRTMRLDAGYALDVATLHHHGGFARGWEPAECAALIADPAVAADGVFSGGCKHPEGFVILPAADEAEIPEHRRRARPSPRPASRPRARAHLARLAEEGAAQVFLEVEEGNLPAERLYRHFGFREVGRRKGYYPKPDGTRATASRCGSISRDKPAQSRH